MNPRINILAPDFREDPYPFYARMRQEAPVSLVDPLGMWAVSRYEDALFILKSPEIFSSRGIMAATEPPWLGRGNPVSDSLLVIDPPQHTRMRALFSRAFTPTAVSRLEPFLREVVRQRLPALVGQGLVDAVDVFSIPVPAAVMAELLGLDKSLSGRFKQWTDTLINVPAIPADALDAQQRVRDTLAEMDHYFQEVIDSRRRAPGDDMVSVMLEVRVDGRALSQRELMGFFYMLLMAGLETTAHTLSFSLLLLSRFPDVQARVRADPSLIPRFIEEVLRYEPPVPSTLRITTAEVELSGVRLPAGTPLLVLFASAQRDEQCASEGDRFSLDRPQQTHLAFGHGPHFCLGAALARLEVRVALEEVLARTRSIEVAPGPIQWNMAPTARGPVKLFVRCEPA